MMRQCILAAKRIIIPPKVSVVTADNKWLTTLVSGLSQARSAAHTLSAWTFRAHRANGIARMDNTSPLSPFPLPLTSQMT